MCIFCYARKQNRCRYCCVPFFSGFFLDVTGVKETDIDEFEYENVCEKCLDDDLKTKIRVGKHVAFHFIMKKNKRMNEVTYIEHIDMIKSEIALESDEKKKVKMKFHLMDLEYISYEEFAINCSLRIKLISREHPESLDFWNKELAKAICQKINTVLADRLKDIEKNEQVDFN